MSFSIIEVGGTYQQIPLLAYYNGAMALAGSMFLGLDYNNYIKQQGLNIELDDEDNIRMSTVASSSPGASNYNPQYDNISLYKNYIDGPNCRIVLGNGTIVIDGLDNGLDIEGRSGNYPFPNALRTGKQEGGTPFIYIGANSETRDGDNYKSGVVRIGAKDAGVGKLSLADFELASTSYFKNISSPNPGNSYLEQDAIGYTQEVLSVLPKTKKTADNKTVTINYVDSISIDGNSVSANYESETITLDRYKLSWAENWTAEKTKEEKSYTIKIEKIDDIGSQSIEFNGDILAIAQKTTDGRYNGIGIVGSNESGSVNSKILLGPIRYKKDIISSDRDIIDIKGYNDIDSNDCWLVGWNFYGLNILGKNIYASKNIYANGKIFIYDNTLKKYFKILHQSEVFNLVKNSENRVIGVLNTNLDNINDSLLNVYNSLNDHSGALDTIADILEALSKGLQTVAGGVTKALGASNQNKNGIGDSLNAARQALSYAVTKIEIVNSSRDGIATSDMSMQIYTDPQKNKGQGELNSNIVVGTINYATPWHTHDAKLTYNANQGTLQIDTKALEVYESGAIWSNSDTFDLTNSLDVRYVLPSDLALGMAWLESTGSSVKGTLSLKSGNTSKVKFNLNNDDTGLHINFVPIIQDVIDEYSYKKETIDQKVEEAFKKGWEDGWTNIRLEPELSEIIGSSSNTFSVWAHFDTYTCQYGTEIIGRDGMLAGQKRINFDIKDFQYWKETAFEYFDYDGNNKITAMAKDRSTELGYTYAYLNVKTYQTGSKQYEYSIRTGQYSSGNEIASGEIGAVAAYNDGWNNAYQMIDWPSLGSELAFIYPLQK